MALMTSSEVNACKIQNMKMVLEGDNVRWVVGVTDADRYYYEVVIYSLAKDASKAAIKAAVAEELLKRKKLDKRFIKLLI